MTELNTDELTAKDKKEIIEAYFEADPDFIKIDGRWMLKPDLHHLSMERWTQ